MKQQNIDQFVEALRVHGPMTTRQLQQVLGLKNSAVQKRIVAARELGLIHVSGHSVLQAKKPYSVQMWAIGSAPSARSSARTYRDALAERKQRAEQLAKSKRENIPARDPFIAQFFGAAP